MNLDSSLITDGGQSKVYNYVLDERNNIPITTPIREYQIKTLIFDIIFNQGESKFTIDVKNICLEDIERISKWAQEFDCETTVRNEFTLEIHKVNSVDLQPKSCPFCGGTLMLSVFDGHDGYDTYTVEELVDCMDIEMKVTPKCNSCTCSLGTFKTLREAISMWNTRG